MKFNRPADQLVEIMTRIYKGGMTTSSGGNLSILGDNGDIWITPSGLDKGGLTKGDICRITPDGKVYGPHKPSVELPFHAEIYKRRPGLRAVLHAHPPAVVAFSLARALPDTRLVRGVYQTLGSITMAAYAVPGSCELGSSIAAEFEKGFDTVVMENHGAVIAAEDILSAYMKFEALEFAARLEINARRLGTPLRLKEACLNLTGLKEASRMDEFTPPKHSSEETRARSEMIRFIRRSCRQGVFGSAQGNLSLRLRSGGFIITPHGEDRAYMEEGSLVLIKDGKREAGKTPSGSIRLYQKIYEKHPEISAVMGARPPNVMAFAVTDTAFDPRTIPESYIMLRSVRKESFESVYNSQDDLGGIAEKFSPQMPVLICENDQVIATGSSLLNVFDRMEVAEATARSIIAAKDIGPLVKISDKEADEINKAFNLD